MKIDPIIAVHKLPESAQWYQDLFGWQKSHGGEEIHVLTGEEGSVMLCLHKWGEPQHPSLLDPSIRPGNGLILYIRTHKIFEIHENAQKLGLKIEQALSTNPNSQMKEFSLRDPDGYFLTVTEHHTYGD